MFLAFLRGVLASAALLIAAGASAQPIGTFSVDGRNPNGTSYTGSVTVSRTGGTYKVFWTIGSGSFVGTGVYTKGAFAVAYAGGHSGVVLYRETEEGVWRGVWAPIGETKTGAETWR
ncbi:MAG: hypothetical protein MRY74_01720 [Neomegalonema sp.]|nr:hypothetical protein [Neomegalonema sp.]